MTSSEKHQSSIVVVNDNPAVRHQWRTALESANFLVIEAGSRVETLTYLGSAESEIDLLVTGLMSDAEGARLAIEVLQSRPSLPIIMAADAAHPVGIRDQFALLLKPVTDSELVNAARTLLLRQVRK